jgi:hypothetical protein
MSNQRVVRAGVERHGQGVRKRVRRDVPDRVPDRLASPRQVLVLPKEVGGAQEPDGAHQRGWRKDWRTLKRVTRAVAMIGLGLIGLWNLLLLFARMGVTVAVLCLLGFAAYWVLRLTD